MTIDSGRLSGSRASHRANSSVVSTQGFDPGREELDEEARLHDLDLEATLQIIYDEEVNVSITTMWDGGFDLSIGGAPGWTEPKLTGCVYGAHNIGPWLRLAYDHAYAPDASQ